MGQRTIFVNGALLAFSKGDPVKVVSYSQPSEPSAMTIKPLPDIPVGQYLEYFALAVYKNRYVLLVGGRSVSEDENGDEIKTPSAQAFVLDTMTETWSTEPDLNFARYAHSSCANERYSFVFGGMGPNALSSIERISHQAQEDGSRAWTTYNIAQITPRRDAFFACTDLQNILVLGGYSNETNTELSDGFVFDADTWEVCKAVSSGNLSIQSDGNQHCLTEYGSILALGCNDVMLHLFEYNIQTDEVIYLKNFGRFY